MFVKKAYLCVNESFNIMKQLTTLLFLWLFALSAHAKSVVFTLRSGALVYYQLGGATNPVMRWTNEGLTVNADAYAVSDIQYFYISAEDAPVSTPVVAPTAHANVYEQGVFTVMAGDEQVSVWTLSGTPVSVPITVMQDSVRIAFTHLPKGVYVVRVGKESFKIQK